MDGSMDKLVMGAISVQDFDKTIHVWQINGLP